MEFAFLWIFMLLIWGLMIAAFVLWIVALVDCLKFQDYEYRAIGSEKSNWVLVVALLGGIGALIYWFSPRSKLKAIRASGGGAYGAQYGYQQYGHQQYGQPQYGQQYQYPQGQPVAQPATPAGWYPNPDNPAQQRWWDGQQWTDHTA